MSEVKGSDLFVRCLEQAGVEYVFAVPGEENLDVVESLRTSDAVELVVTRHEQHAAFMAATLGRLTGRAGVCLATLGPGATNLATGIAHAQLGSFPLVAITGQKPAVGNWQGKFQLIDVVGTMAPLTKWSASISSARAIPQALRHAFQTAEGERSGAVLIELPEDVAKETAAVAPLERVACSRPVADPRSLELAADLVRSARRPLVVVSGGGSRPGVAASLRRFADATGIHVLTTQMGKGALPEYHPRSLLCMGIHGQDFVHAAFDHTDLVITVGYDIAEYPPAVWNPRNDQRILHIDHTVPEPDEYYMPDLELVGDIGPSLDALAGMLETATFEDAPFGRLQQLLRERLHEDRGPDGHPLAPLRVVSEVRAALGEDDIVSLDNGIYKIWFARHYQAFAPSTLLLDNALGTMGAGLGAAMAAKLVHPDKKVLAVCGDGGFLMNLQDLETAVRLEQDLVVLIVRDDAYGFIRWKQAQDGFPDFAMDFGNPDFVQLAEAFGAKGLAVGPKDALADVLDEAFRFGGPVLVDCPIDYSHNETLSADHAEEARAYLKETR